MTEAEKVTNSVLKMSDDELREFVDDFVSGRVFTSAQIAQAEGPDMLGMIFLPLTFGALSEWTHDEMTNIGVVWEKMSSAGPQSVNGYPIFISLRLMHKEDWARAVVAIKAEEQRRKTIPI